MGRETSSTTSAQQIVSVNNSSCNSTNNSNKMTAIATAQNQKGSEHGCSQRRWSKLDCSVSPYAPSSSMNASNSHVKFAEAVISNDNDETLEILNQPKPTRQQTDSGAADPSSSIRRQLASGPRAKKSIVPSNSRNKATTSSPETPKQDGTEKKKKTSLTFAEVVLDEAIPSPPTMPQRRETLQLSPTSARKTSDSLLPDYCRFDDDDNDDVDNPHTCGPINGKKTKEVKGILKKKLSDSTASTVSSSTATRSSDATVSSLFDDDTAPAPPTMPQRRDTIQLSPKTARKTSLTIATPNLDEPVAAPPAMPQRRDTIQLSPKAAKKTSLTFATPNLDEPIPIPPVMPIRRETLQLSPKTARQTSLTLANDAEFNESLLLSDEEDENVTKQREVKSILKKAKQKKSDKKQTSTSFATSSRKTSSHDPHNEPVPGTSMDKAQPQATEPKPPKKTTSLTFADVVLDEPVPAPPTMPIRRETLQLSPKSARKTSLTLEGEPDLDWDDDDEDAFNKLGSCCQGKDKKQVKSILKKKKIDNVHVRKQRSVSPGRKNMRPVVRPASPTRSRQ